MARCIDCLHFCNWDMDWCCTSHMKIISYIKDKKTTNPENCTKERNCEDFEDASVEVSPIQMEVRKDEWDFFLNSDKQEE